MRVSDNQNLNSGNVFFKYSKTALAKSGVWKYVILLILKVVRSVSFRLL